MKGALRQARHVKKREIVESDDAESLAALCMCSICPLTSGQEEKVTLPQKRGGSFTSGSVPGRFLKSDVARGF